MKNTFKLLMMLSSIFFATSCGNNKDKQNAADSLSRKRDSARISDSINADTASRQYIDTTVRSGSADSMTGAKIKKQP